MKEEKSHISPERMDQFTTKASDNLFTWTPAENKIRRKKQREALTRKSEQEVKRRRKNQRENRR